MTHRSKERKRSLEQHPKMKHIFSFGVIPRVSWETPSCSRFSLVILKIEVGLRVRNSDGERMSQTKSSGSGPIVIDSWLGKKTWCHCDGCQMYPSKHGPGGLLARLEFNNTFPPDWKPGHCHMKTPDIYRSRLNDRICRIKGQIKYRYPDDEDSDDDSERDSDELFVQLNHERSHARNLQPRSRELPLASGIPLVVHDPDCVICEF